MPSKGVLVRSQHGKRLDSRERGDAARSLGAHAGFTLIELLVSIAVITVLIGLMFPAIAHVRESARRVVCGSNLRQIGIATHMFADQNRGQLPPSVFLDAGEDGNAAVQDMITVRLSHSDKDTHAGPPWDGLGVLYAEDYLSAPQIYYCPSHSGQHPFDRYASSWSTGTGEIVSNYQFRGTGPRGSRVLDNIDSMAALVTDGMRSYDDFNHRVGFNVLRAGLSVQWVSDDGGQIAALLQTAGLDSGDGSVSPQTVYGAWNTIDGSLSGSAGLPQD